MQIRLASWFCLCKDRLFEEYFLYQSSKTDSRNMNSKLISYGKNFQVKTVHVLVNVFQVDFAAVVEPELLEDLKTVVPDLEVGGRTCVDAEGRGKVITTLDEHSYKTSAGGSLSNTLVALSRLSSAECASTSGAECEEAEKKVDVSIACSLGPDYLGEFYRTKLKKAGVQVS